MNKSSSIEVKFLCLILLIGFLSLLNTLVDYRSDIRDAEIRHSEDVATLIDYLRVPVEDYLITGNLTNLRRLAERTIETQRVSAIVLLSPDGDHVVSFPERIDYSLPMVEVDLIQSFSQEHIGLDTPSPTVEASRVMGRMIVYLNHSKRIAAMNTLHQELLLSSLAILAIVICMVATIRYHFLFPLRKVFEDANHILQGRYDKVRKLERHDELGHLSSYLEEIANDFSSRDSMRKEQLREIVQTNADITVLRKEKDFMIDRLLGGLVPSLQEAMNTVGFLHDKPSLQANLSKSILFAISLADEANTMIMAHSKRMTFTPEKLYFPDMLSLVKEYLDFFVERSNIEIDFRADHPPSQLQNFLILDKKEMMRLFAYVFELLDARPRSTTKKVRFLMLFESSSDSTLTMDIVINTGGHGFGERLCTTINTFFASATTKDSVTELRQMIDTYPESGVQAFTLLGLKRLINSLGGQYAVIKKGADEYMHAISIPLEASQDESKVDEQIKRLSEDQNQPITVIGSEQFIRRVMQKHYGSNSSLKFETYETEASLLRSDQHYIIDLISDRETGLAIARRLSVIQPASHNIAAVISSASARENTLFGWCDVDFDMFFHETVSPEDLQRIKSRKHVSDRHLALRNILDNIKGAGENNL